jgi:phosphocarrier protein
VLALGARRGTEVTIEAEGDGAEASLDALADLLVRDLDAPEEAKVSESADG